MATRLWAGPGVMVLAVAVTACELEEITVVQAEEVVVVEAYVNVAAEVDDNEIVAFLHQTVGSEDVDAARTDLIASRLTVRRPADGLIVELLTDPLEECVDEPRENVPGACFRADSVGAARVRPGDVLTLDVELVDGGHLQGGARVPGSFELVGLPERCRIVPDTVMPLRWSRSEGARAYLNETAISGLPAALRPEGIVVDEDPLYLLGLSISDADTTITFPSEFGVFNRFDLDQDLAVRLQRGLPAGASAEITITAVERNYVNWARGGNFNPSGQVRVPSLRGDGLGVFGATVHRRLRVTASGVPLEEVPDCPIGSG